MNTANIVMTNYTKFRKEKIIMKFKTVYHFSVMDEVKEGNKVYFLDKKAKVVGCFNDAPLECALTVISKAKEDDERFVCWKEIEETDG